METVENEINPPNIVIIPIRPMIKTDSLMSVGFKVRYYLKAQRLTSAKGQ
jgi:hypothetical protein